MMNRRRELPFSLSKEQKAEILPALTAFIQDEMEYEITGLHAQFLLGYITEHLGKYYYNQGVAQAMESLSEKIEDLYLLMAD